MANPNLINVTSVVAHTAQTIPSNTSVNTSWTTDGTTSVTGLTPASNSINRVTSIVVANTTASAATATVAVGNNATFGSATTVTYLAYQISVPANSTLVVTDKTTMFYVMESQSVAVQSGTGSALTYTATYETFT